MKKPLQPALKWLAATLAMATLAGCAALQPAKPEEIVSKRVGEYWAARVKGDSAKAYAYTTPAYRQLRSAEQFRLQAGTGNGIQSGEPVRVNCSDDRCEVRVKMMATPAIPGVNLGTIPVYVDEVWLLEGGQWWLHQEI